MKKPKEQIIKNINCLSVKEGQVYQYKGSFYRVTHISHPTGKNTEYTVNYIEVTQKNDILIPKVYFWRFFSEFQSKFKLFIRATKPPLGITPRFIFERERGRGCLAFSNRVVEECNPQKTKEVLNNRILEIINAIKRLREINHFAPYDWYKELEELSIEYLNGQSARTPPSSR